MREERVITFIKCLITREKYITNLEEETSFAHSALKIKASLSLYGPGEAPGAVEI